MRVRGWGGQIQGAREEQQDVWALLPSREDRGWAALVADGMGGLLLGGKAASRAVEGATRALEERGAPEERLSRALEAAQGAVLALARREGVPGYVGTTLVLALLGEEGLRWVSVGDSRLYLWRRGTLRLLTEDHTLGARLRRAVAAGRLDPEEPLRHPERDALVSFVGIEELREVDRSGGPLALEAGDRVLLATDGVTRALDEGEMGRILGEEDPAETLLRAVESRGLRGQDNATVVVLEWKGGSG